MPKCPIEVSQTIESMLTRLIKTPKECSIMLAQFAEGLKTSPIA